MTKKGEGEGIGRRKPERVRALWKIKEGESKDVGGKELWAVWMERERERGEREERGGVGRGGGEVRNILMALTLLLPQLLDIDTPIPPPHSHTHYTNTHTRINKHSCLY